MLVKAVCWAGRLAWFFCSPSSAGLSCGNEEEVVILYGFYCRAFQGQRSLPLLCFHIPTDCSPRKRNSLLTQNFFSTFKISVSFIDMEIAHGPSSLPKFCAEEVLHEKMWRLYYSSWKFEVVITFQETSDKKKREYIVTLDSPSCHHLALM